MRRVTIIAAILAAFGHLSVGQRPGAAPRIVQLPQARLAGTISLERALALRRSVRQFTGQPLELAQIAQLAWAGQGITEPERGFRTAPSAGAIYPIELYFATQQGLFVYNPYQHSLEQIFAPDIRGSLAEAALRQEVVAAAPCDIIIAGSVGKVVGKYGNNARRFMTLEAGHVGQNILLQAASLELGAVPVGAFDVRAVRRVCRLPSHLEPLEIICVGYPPWAGAAQQSQAETRPAQTKPDEAGDAKVKKAVLIVASNGFQDHELSKTRDELEKAEVKTVVASTRTGVIRGVLGKTVKATILVNDIVVDDYDAIIFIGGPGASEYFDNWTAFDIVREAADKRKIVGAICIAPTILANAGLLGGVRATAFSSERIRLKKAGARFTGAAVERDGPIITANGPKAASQFGRAIAEALGGR